MIFRNEATAGQWDDVECNKNLTFVCRFATCWKLIIRKSNLVGLSVVGLPESISHQEVPNQLSRLTGFLVSRIVLASDFSTVGFLTIDRIA